MYMYVFILLSDSSKVRHRIRKKLCEEKKNLQELVAEYNLITPVVCTNFVELSDIVIQEGNWPWITVIGEYRIILSLSAWDNFYF